jgi:hypothetical protein
MATATERGSAELLKQRPIHEQDLKALLGTLHEHDAKILHWFPKGIPAPEVLYGAVRVQRESIGKIVDQLITTEGLRLRLDVFPYGIPYPDEVIVNFETHQGTFGG